MSRNSLWGVGAVMLATAMLGAPARAGVEVGDKPNVIFETVEGKKFTTRDLAGRIVVLDFWATWCGPCVAEIPHMIRLHQELGPRGVQLIGISLDSDKRRAQSFAEEKKMTWPQVCDGKGWKSDYAQQFGVSSIPRVFILSPEGQVLWIGHPAKLDAPLREALEKHPPQLRKADPREDALELIERATEALTKERDAGKALTALSTLDPKLVRDEKVVAALKKFAGVALDEANKDDLAKALADHPEAGKALEMLRGLTAPKPPAAAEAPTAEQAAMREQLASRRLAAAVKLADDGKHADAYEALAKIKQLWPDTPAGEQAAQRVQAYEADEAFMTSFRQTQREKQARADLSMGDTYREAGQKDQAAQCYQRVIDDLPDSPLAQEAKTKLRQLN